MALSRKIVSFIGLFLLLSAVGLMPVTAGELDRSDVNAFDRVLMFPYSEPLSVASDVTQYLSLLSPVMFACAAPSSDWFDIALMYAGASALSFGTRTVLKATVVRERPYQYFSDPPSEADHDQSFPSGHSVMAFTGAAFTQALFSLRYPDSPYRIPVTASAWTLAAATAVLRVASGNHFVTDVLAGALIGSFYGFAVPYVCSLFNTDEQNDGVVLSVGPNMVAVRVGW